MAPRTAARRGRGRRGGAGRGRGGGSGRGIGSNGRSAPPPQEDPPSSPEPSPSSSPSPSNDEPDLSINLENLQMTSYFGGKTHNARDIEHPVDLLVCTSCRRSLLLQGALVVLGSCPRGFDMANASNIRGASKSFANTEVFIGGRNRQDPKGARNPMGIACRDHSKWAKEQTQIQQHLARLSDSPFQLGRGHGGSR